MLMKLTPGQSLALIFSIFIYIGLKKTYFSRTMDAMETIKETGLATPGLRLLF